MILNRVCIQCNCAYSYEIKVHTRARRKFCSKCLEDRKYNFFKKYLKKKEDIYASKEPMFKEYDMKAVFGYDEVNILI